MLGALKNTTVSSIAIPVLAYVLYMYVDFYYYIKQSIAHGIKYNIYLKVCPGTEVDVRIQNKPNFRREDLTTT